MNLHQGILPYPVNSDKFMLLRIIFRVANYVIVQLDISQDSESLLSLSNLGHHWRSSSF